MKIHPKLIRAALILSLAALSKAAHADCALPNQLMNGQTADATQVMANFAAVVTCLQSVPAGQANAIQLNGGTGALSSIGPLANGQLVIGSTGNAPQAATLTAGPGIAIANGPSVVTITATGGGSGGGAWPPYLPPTTSMFPTDKGISGITVTQADDTSAGYLNYVDMTSLTAGDKYAAKVASITNSGDWYATWRMTFSALDFNYWGAGVVLYKEGSPNIALFGYTYSSNVLYDVLRYNQSSGAFVDTNFSHTGYNTGQGNFFKITYTQASDTLTFLFSKNGKIWEKLGSAASTSFLGGAPDHIGFGNSANASGGDFGNTGFTVDYWSTNAF